jgi:hypothetical protein
MPKIDWDLPAQAFLESYRKSSADYKKKKKKKKEEETEAERLARIEAEEKALLEQEELEQKEGPITPLNSNIKIPTATKDIIKKKKNRRTWGWMG